MLVGKELQEIREGVFKNKKRDLPNNNKVKQKSNK